MRTPTLAQLRALADDRRRCGDSAGYETVIIALEYTPTGRAPQGCTWCFHAPKRGLAEFLAGAVDGAPLRCRYCADDPDVPPIADADQARSAAAAVLAAHPLTGSRWYESARLHGASAEEWREIAAHLRAQIRPGHDAGHEDRARDADARAAEIDRRGGR